MRSVRTAILGAVLAVLVVGTAALTVLAWRLERGPIPLPWLDRRLEQAFGDLAPGLRATVGHTELAWIGWTLDVRVSDLRLLRPDGSLVASLPLLSVRPSLSALLVGRFAVSQVGLAGVKLAVVRTPDGSLALPGITTEGAAGGDLAALLTGSATGGSRASYLRRVFLRGAAVSLDDERSGSRWELEEVDMEIRRRGERLRVVADGRVRLRPGAAGELRALSVHAAATATVDLAEAGISAAEGTIVVNDGEVALRGDSAPPLAVHRVGASLRYSATEQALEAADLHAEVGGGSADATLRIALAPEAKRFEARGELRGVSAAEVTRLWPPSLAAATRQWIADNIRAGSVTRGRFALDVPLAAAPRPEPGAPPRHPTADVAFDFEGLELHYLGDLPPARALRGSATLDAGRFAAKVSEGTLGALRIRRGAVDIDYHAEPVTLTVAADTDGPTAEVLGLIDRPPLRLLSKIGLPSAIGGTSDVHADIRLPIVKGLDAGQVKVVAEGKLHGASHPALLGALGIDGGELVVDAEETGAVTVRGTVALTGLPVAHAKNEVAIRYAPHDGEATLEATIDGPDAHGRGNARFAAGALQTLDVSRLQLGRNDLKAQLTRDPAGVVHVSFDGERLDLETAARILRGARGDDRRPTAPYALDFRFARVDATPDVELTDVSGAARSDGSHLRQATATGRLASGGTLQLDLGSGPAGGTLRAHVDHGGEMLHALGYVDGISGGTLEVTAAIGDGGERRFRGELEFTDFRVMNVPLLGKLLSLGSLDGMASLLGKEGLQFSRLNAPFVWTDTTIEIHDARAVGAIGITSRGIIDRANHKIDLEGDLIPLDSLNSAIGKVPVVGSLITGKSSEIFGIGYQVRGDLKSPDIHANPLSALAPGALRKMFSSMFPESKPKPAKTPAP